MSYVKVKIPNEVYHLTKRNNLAGIFSDRKIRRFNDQECWFCRSIPDLLRYMKYTVLCTGKPYIDIDGSVKRYPPFVPEDYVVLRLTPKYREGNWYPWNQELPPDSPPELKQQAREFSSLKISFRDDLRFKDAEVITLSQIMKPILSQEENEQAEKETNEMICAEDAVESTIYLTNAPDCCTGKDQLENVLGMFGANVIDKDIYHSQNEHLKMSM